MDRPEGVLLGGAETELGGGDGVRVYAREREVHEDPADFAGRVIIALLFTYLICNAQYSRWLPSPLG